MRKGKKSAILAIYVDHGRDRVHIHRYVSECLDGRLDHIIRLSV